MKRSVQIAAHILKGRLQITSGAWPLNEYNLDNFLPNGWCVLKLDDPRPVMDAISTFQDLLRATTHNSQITLETYHLHFTGSDEEHLEHQYKMTEFCRKEKVGREIIRRNLGPFQRLISQDLDVQVAPYLRIVRPNTPQDNVGFHRDTFYGGTPWEVSISIPFVDLPEESALRILPGSHIQPESTYPTKQVERVHKRGSVKHQLGFPYSPKIISPETLESCTLTPIPLKVGEVVAFSLSTVHGSALNDGPTTRWTMDVRLKNALAPIDMSKRVGYYEPLTRNPVTEQALIYQRRNEAE